VHNAAAPQFGGVSASQSGGVPRATGPGSRPGVTWNRFGQGTQAGPRFRLEFDLGDEDPVRKLTLHASGKIMAWLKHLRPLIEFGWLPFVESEREWLFYLDEATILSWSVRVDRS